MIKKLILLFLITISIIVTYTINPIIKIKDDRNHLVYRADFFSGIEKSISWKKKIIFGNILVPKYIYNNTILISHDGKKIEHANYLPNNLIELVIEDNFFIITNVSKAIDIITQKYNIKCYKVYINYAETHLYFKMKDKNIVICFDNLKLDANIFINRDKRYDLISKYNFIDCRFKKYMLLKSHF